MQTKKMSLIESGISVAIGFIVALITQVAVFPIFDIEVSISQNISISVIFTVVSIIRSYYVRRLFNWISINK